MTTDERASFDTVMRTVFARFHHDDVYRLRLQARLCAGAALR
jgi:hypothetical protein